MPLQSKREYGSVVLVWDLGDWDSGLCHLFFFLGVLLFLNSLYLVLRQVLIMVFLNFTVV